VNKNNFLKTKAIAFFLLTLCLISQAGADLIFSYPKIANRETSKIEVGSSPQITIKYENRTSSSIFITSAAFHLIYDSSIIDQIINIKNENPANLQEKENDISTAGEIHYKLEISSSNPNPLKVPAGKTVDLATITFHVNQGLSPRWVFLLRWSGVIPSEVYYKTVNVTGSLVSPVAIYLEPSMPPSFSGLNRAVSANALGVQNPGNTVILEWIAAGTAAWDRTKYYNNKLSYRILRDTDSGFRSPSELPITEPTHNPEDDPMLRAPFTGNIAGKDYVYEDKDLDDGTTYYYKIVALDDTSPNPNLQERTTVLEVTPLDLTPPGEVKNLTVVAGDNRLTLRWENPNDNDLGGVVIVRNTGRPVGAGNLGSASAAPPYAHGPEWNMGDTPFGPENGTIVFISPQESDPSAVPTEFEDLEVENGVIYYYKVFTYDRAEEAGPRQMGRNYSKGVSISKAPGIPPRPISNFTATRGLTPGEVIFSWDNSPDEFCDGVMIRYTTDERLKFSALRDERSGNLVGFFPITSGPGMPESVTLSLPSGWTYYFKAFAYNRTGLTPEDPDFIARASFSAGQMAAVNLPAEEAEILFTYTYEFQPGINYFAIPFPAERVVDELGRALDISTWEKLIDVLNSQARAQTGENAIRTLGRWNALEQKAEGIVEIDYTKVGPERFTCTPGTSSNTPVIQGEPYVISVSKPFTFTLRAIIPRTR